MQLANAYHHFITITTHKLTVMDLCFRIGLIRQGILHDLSKYSPEEFATGIRYYQGIRSPNAAGSNSVSRVSMHDRTASFLSGYLSVKYFS